MEEDIKARVEAAFDELRDKMRHWAETPIDLQNEDDSELEDHLWTVINSHAGEADLEALGAMTAGVRAYFVTRLFEWLTANDGPDAFPGYYPHLLDLLPGAYRHLGMEGPAAIAERLVAAPPVKRLATDDDYMLTEAEQDDLNNLVDQIGMNDAARLTFARSHPESCSLTASRSPKGGDDPVPGEGFVMHEP